jgi:hypothetical protein
MITYVNSSNAEKYSVLFSAATQSLLAAGVLQPAKENGAVLKDDTGLVIAEDPITTVEQYFSYLPDLIALGASDKVYDALRSEGRRYTMLPLDEAAFQVDANSRIISVPPEFQTNGVGVQGDKYAEILYFVVDRFFDITDLDTCDIYIQWTNANGESGVSTPWVVDIESEPNKMIIGWALSSDITKYAGTLKFALRFFQWDDKLLSTIKYSWSTLTQTVSVKSSLDFVFGNGKYMIEDEINEAITNRIVNSNTQLAGVAKAERPEYTINLVEYRDLVENKTYLTELPDCAEIYPLEVQARSTDGGLISYYWRYIDQYGNEQTPNLGGTDDPTGSLVRVEFRTVDTSAANIAALRLSNKLLYEKDTDEDGGDIYLATTLPEDDYAASLLTLYERVAVCVVNRVGSYNAVAVNRLSGRNMAERKSVVCVIPMPSLPIIDTNLPVRGHMGIEVATDDTDASTVTLKVVVSNPEENGTKEGELIYVWYKRRIDAITGVETSGNKVNWSMDEDGREIVTEDAACDWLKIEGAENAELVLTNTTEAMNAPKSIEGKYKVVIYNYKNLKYVSIGSSECRVSYTAVDPVIAYPQPDSDETKVDFSNEVAVRNQIKVELDDEWTALWNISDDITYQWYQTSDDVAHVEGDSALVGETAAQFIPTSTGKFYCQVTNHKNDTRSSVVSQIFYVV